MFNTLMTTLLGVLALASVSYGYTVMNGAAALNQSIERVIASDEDSVEDDNGCIQTIVEEDGQSMPHETCEE